MKSSIFLPKLAIKAIALIVAPLLTMLAKALSVKLIPEFIFLILFVAFPVAIVLVPLLRIQRQNETSRKVIECEMSRQDLWSRLTFQGPFADQIRNDEQERMLYGESIVRKLDALAEHHRKFVDEPYCSRYIGALAFYANEKRANVPWEVFRDALAANFKDLILLGKIMPHVINDHYKGKFEDLLDAARRKDAEVG